MIDRRTLMKAGAALGVTALRSGRLFAQERAIEALSRITGDVLPIGRAERAARVTRAQAAMAKAGIGALLIEPGASLIYYTGVRWWRSERLTACVLPVEGPPIIVTPFFEAPSVEESLGIDADIRVWQEDENPAAVIAACLTHKGLAKSRIGIEETVRYFAVDGLQAALPGATILRDPVTRALRMRKAPAEIALMQKATDVTIAAYRWTYPQIRGRHDAEGYRRPDVGRDHATGRQDRVQPHPAG